MKALIVIDMQNVCVGKSHAKYFHYNDNLIENVNTVIDANSDNLVVYIRNIMKRNFINRLAPFHAYANTEEAELASELHIVSDHIFDKYVGDAFSNPNLNQLLKAKNVSEIELVGVDGAGCIALTAHGAIKNGYRVTMNTNAVGSLSEKKQMKSFAKLKAEGVFFV